MLSYATFAVQNFFLKTILNKKKVIVIESFFVDQGHRGEN
jgi:hypothetical protein